MKKFHNHIARAAYQFITEHVEKDETLLKRHFHFALIISGRGSTQGQIIPLQYASQVNSALEGQASTSHELWRVDHSTKRAHKQ